MLLTNVLQQGTINAWMNYRNTSALELSFQDNSIVLHPIKNSIMSANMTFGQIQETEKFDLATTHKDGSVNLYKNKGYRGYAYGELCQYRDTLGAGSNSYMTMGLCGYILSSN